MLAERFEFEDFELDRSVYELRRAGSVIHLERIPLDLLFLLVERRGQLVTRQEIFERIWGKGVFVDTDNSINTAVRKLRHALHDDPDAPHFLVTVPAKGYRFIAPIREEGPTAPASEASSVSAVAEASPTADAVDTSPMTIAKADMPLRKNRRRGVLWSIGGIAIVIAVVVLIQQLSLRGPTTTASIHPTQSPALPLPDEPSIAVLPFTNMSGDREQEYFSDGITDDLITALSRFPDLFVIARTSAFTYKGKALKVQDVSRELGVKYILEGSVKKAGGQVRITAQLVDATTGEDFWAEQYDRPLRDIFALQDEIVRRIVTTLKLQLALAQRGLLIPRETENLEAYDDVLRGVEYILSYTKDGNAKARQMFEKAIVLDPKYARAYWGLGGSYYAGWALLLSPEPSGLERAFQLEQQAIALDDSLSPAHSLLAGIYAQKGQFDQAVAEAERGIALNPNYARGYTQLADVMNHMGRPTEALVAVEKAMRLDPRNRDNYLFVQGWAYTQLGRYQEAIPALKRDLALTNSLWDDVFLVQDFFELGQEDAARAQAAEVDRRLALNPNPMGYLALADVMNHLAEPAQALVAVDKAMRLDPRNRDRYLFEQGYAYTQLGYYEEAIPALKRSLSLTNSLWDRVFLVADYVELGQEDAARTEAAEVERRVALNHNSPLGYSALAEVMNSLARPAEALVALEKAMRLDPGNRDLYLSDVGWTYQGLGRYEDSSTAYKRYLALHPDIFWGHLGLAIDDIELGHDDTARAEAAEVLRLNPQFNLKMIYRTVGPKGKVLAENARWSADLRKAGLK